jgi:predicted PurR-regulated permease PerM
MPNDQPAPRGGLSTHLLAAGLVLVAIVFLRMARTVLLPLVGGLIVAALVAPLMTWLARAVPRGIALLATVLLVVALFLGTATAIGYGAKHVGERMQERRARIEQVHGQLGALSGRLGLQLPPLPGAEGPDGRAEREPRRDASAGSRSPLVTVLGGAGSIALAIGFMALALAEAADARRKIRGRFPAETAERLIGIGSEVASHLRRYLLVKSLTSGITGATTLLVALAFGLDFAVLWGALTFLLEFVPTIGSILAVIPPSLYAALQFEGLARPLAVAGTLTVAQLVLGNYVDPKIEGRLLALSPIVVLLSVVFWAWVWGPAGSLLGVPMTVTITTVARHFDGTRWLWALLTEPDRG